MKNSYKKITAAALAAILCTALTACGNIDDDSSKSAADISSGLSSESESVSENSSDNAVTGNTDETTEDNSSSSEQNSEINDSSTQAQQSSSDNESESESSAAEIPDITGCFSESVDGQDSGYVIINNSSSGYLIGKEAHIGVPLEYSLTADKILVNRGGMDDSAEQVSYTYSDGVLTFTENDKEYKWTSIDYIPIHGTYYEVDENGTHLSQWEFNADGTGKISGSNSDKDTSISYEQTADNIIITNESTKEKTSYTYQYNIIKLSLSAADGTVLNFDSDQSEDTNH